jgi:hypothetical protein
MVPMVSPDGITGMVPQEQVQAAVQAGRKLGVKILAPDGTPGTIPMDRAHEAIKAGGMLAPPGIPKPAVPQMQTSALGKVYDTVENGPGGGRSLPNPKLAESSGVVEGASQDTISNSLATGALKAGLQTVHSGLAVAGKAGVPGLPTSFQEPANLQPEGAAENIGAGAEGILEFMTGDELLKGLSLADKLGLGAKIAQGRRKSYIRD